MNTEKAEILQGLLPLIRLERRSSCGTRMLAAAELEVDLEKQIKELKQVDKSEEVTQPHDHTHAKAA